MNIDYVGYCSFLFLKLSFENCFRSTFFSVLVECIVLYALVPFLLAILYFVEQSLVKLEGWEDTVTIISSDMRHWDASEKADILVRAYYLESIFYFL